MAKIEYKEGVKPLNGIYGGMLYKTHASGKCTVFVQPLPSAEEAGKNPAARADRIVKLCVSNIQTQMSDMYEACKQYTNITHRVRRLYGELYELEKSETKLIKMILEAYRNSRRVLPSRKVRHPQLALDTQNAKTYD